MSLRDDNRQIAEEAGLGYEVAQAYAVLQMAASNGDSDTVVAIVDAENGSLQTFVGFYELEEAVKVAERVSRMRKLAIHAVFIISNQHGLVRIK